MPRDPGYKTNIVSALSAFHSADLNEWFDEYEEAYRRHHNSCPKRRIRWDLSLEQFWGIVFRARGVCEVTNTPFNPWFRAPTTNTRPYIPSIDRIDSTLGYSFENVRLVVYLCNISMNQYGEGPFYEMVRNTMMSPGFNNYIATTQGYAPTDMIGHNYFPNGMPPVMRYLVDKSGDSGGDGGEQK